MEDGSLKAIGKDAEKAAASTDKATKAADKYSKKQKGVAGISSNSTKNFSKMTTGITGGLVPAYATLAANVFALTAAFGVLSRNDAIAKLEEGLNFTGRAAGRSLTLVADKLKEITDNAISAEQAMRTTAIGVSAGFSQTQMEGLAKVAKGASLALGRDMADAMDRLTRGAAKLEPEILDELGIMVRLDDAVDTYAQTMGKAVGDLTQFERRQAFTNAIIEDGRQKFDALAEAVDASPYAQLAASFSDMSKTFIHGINSVFGPLLGFLAKTPMAFGALAAAFGASISGQMLGGLEKLGEKATQAAQQTANIGAIRTLNLKPVAHMGKAFNRLADQTELTSDELKTMHKSASMTVNMMNKSNPMYKDAVKTRGKLTRATHLFTMAQNKEKAATALSMIQTHGLSAAFTAHRAALATNSAQTAAAAKGQDFYTAAVLRTRHALFATAATAKFAGAAILTAMPYIAMAVGLISVLVPLFQKFFGTEDTKLSKAIENNDKRLSDMRKTTEQWKKSIKGANSESDAWIRTLTPLAGMLTEAASGMRDLLDSVKADQLLRAAKATDALAAAEEKLAKATGNNKRAARVNVRNKKADTETAGTATVEEMDRLFIEGTRTVNTFNNEVETMRETLTGLAEDGQPVNQALSVVTSAQTEVNTAFEEFKKNRTEEGYLKLEAAIKKQADSANAAVDASKSFNDTLSKAKELTGNTTATWGLFGEEIDNVAEGLRQVNAILAKDGTEAAEKRAQKLLDAYGVKPQTFDLTANLSKADEAKIPFEAYLGDSETYTETAVQALGTLEAKLQGVRERFISMSKDSALLEAGMLPGQGAMSENDVAVMRNELAQEAVDLAKEKMEIAKEGSEKEYEALLEMIKLEKERTDLIKERFNLLAGEAKGSGMGAGASAAIAGMGIVAAAAGKSEDEQDAARAEAAEGTLRGMAEDMKALGPEGALMSSAIEGAFNLQTAFSTAFAAMDADSATMTDKVQAGIGATIALISTLSQVTKAASDQKIKGIENEIARERQRDGQSAASVKKIQALEAKKEKEKRKAFETEKKMKIAQTIMSTAQGIMAAFQMGPIVGAIMGTMIAAMGMKQIQMIRAQQYNGGSGAPSGGSIEVGKRNNTVDLAKSNSASGELAYARGAEGTGNMSNFKPAFTGYKHRQAGGYVVGEQGPELFVPQTPGEIVPAGKTGEMSTTNVNFSISTVDAAGVEDLLMNQRGNIIGMIREAANEHGEVFLEGVQEDAY